MHHGSWITMNCNDLPRFASVQEVAKSLLRTEDAVRVMCRSGEIPAHKIGNRYLIRQDEFIEWCEKQRVNIDTQDYRDF